MRDNEFSDADFRSLDRNIDSLERKTDRSIDKLHLEVAELRGQLRLYNNILMGVVIFLTWVSVSILMGIASSGGSAAWGVQDAERLKGIECQTNRIEIIQGKLAEIERLVHQLSIK